MLKKISKKRLLVLPLAGSLLLLLAACEKVPTQEQSGGASQAPAAAPAGAPAEPTAAPAAAPAAAAEAQPPASGPEAPFLQAVETYLQKVKSIDTSLMTIQIQDLKVDGPKATAKVVYGAKKGEMPPMVYLYDFTQENGAWTVLKSQPAGGDAHAGMGMPQGMGGDMPPGHPAVEGQMPAHGSAQGK